jgi:glycosyltransferase involved in cell wall biosynthesis
MPAAMRRDPPLVSAITIFLNAERFLRESVESVLAQTYRHWELLLVDDGSKDGSTAMAREYADRYPGRMHYFEHDGHQNRGMSASRNLGLRHASGTYIALLDADDVWLPQRLERHIAALEAHPEAGSLLSPVQWWRTWDPEGGRADSVQDFGVGGDVVLRPPALLPRFLRDERRAPGTCGLLARRRLAELVGGFEDAFRGMYEDQVFYAKLCLAAPVVVSGECASRVRLRADSCTATAGRTGQHDAAREAFLCWLADYLRRQGIRDAETARIVRRERWRLRCTRLLVPLTPMVRHGTGAWRLVKSAGRPLLRVARSRHRGRNHRRASEGLGANIR